MISLKNKIFTYKDLASLRRCIRQNKLNRFVRYFKTCGIIESEVRVRFAPSPTGQLHIGGFRTALYNYLFSRSKPDGGKFILRIEDTDQTRLVPNAASQLESLLEWAGIAPDESPTKGGPFGPYTQSDRLSLYESAVQKLLDTGHAYRCFCTERRLELLKKEAARNRTNNKYDGRCAQLTSVEVEEKLSKGLPCTIRFKLKGGVEENTFINDNINEDNSTFDDLVYGNVNQSGALDNEGDPIIVKSDGYPVYHFANVVDDHHMEITHVFRGVEWLVSTPKHIALYKAFGWIPPFFGHLPLMMNADGTKLSKRHKDGTGHSVHVEQFRENGYYSDALINFLTLTGGGFRDKDFALNNLFTLEELSSRFEYKLFKTHSSKVDFERLESLNQMSLQLRLDYANHESVENSQITHHNLYTPDVLAQAKGYLNELQAGKKIDISDDILLKRLKWLVHEGRITKLSDLSVSTDLQFLWFEPNLLLSYGNGVTALIIEEVIDALKTCDGETESLPSKLSNMVRNIAKRHKKNGLKVSELMAGIRLALSGLREGPPVGEMLQNLGLNTAIYRLEKVARVLK